MNVAVCVVMDCNVIISQLLEDESNAYADAAFDWIAKQPDIQIICPAIWPLEVQNTLLMAMRRKRCTRKDVDDWLAELSTLPVVIDHCMTLFDREVVELAEQYSLSAYDASYLTLAKRRSAILITLDSALQRAAKSHGVKQFVP